MHSVHGDRRLQTETYYCNEPKPVFVVLACRSPCKITGEENKSLFLHSYETSKAFQNFPSKSLRGRRVIEFPHGGQLLNPVVNLSDMPPNVVSRPLPFEPFLCSNQRVALFFTNPLHTACMSSTTKHLGKVRNDTHTKKILVPLTPR